MFLSVSFECFFILLFLFTSTFAVHIENVVVPEVIQSGNPAVLECQYSSAEERYRLQWLFNGSQVYEWSPGMEPTLQGVLDGNIDFTYDASLSNAERKAVRILSAEPEMSGDYTCRVQAGAQQASVTKTMLVFSPEKEFSLRFHRRNNSIEVVCEARGLYPQPELTIERNGITNPNQHQRLWRNESLLYDAQTIASLYQSPLKPGTWAEQVTCRLQLLIAGYTAMKRETFCFEEKCECNASPRLLVTGICLLLGLLANQMQVN